MNFTQRGESRLRNGKYHEAFFDFSKCIEIEPKMIPVYNFRAKTRGLLKDYKGAIEDYLIVLSDKPDHGQALYEIGITYFMTTKWKKEKTHLEKLKNLEFKKLQKY
ncbi:tetratricopeptide repeat protein [Flavobacterium phycosphaerae]|uniref:tetratricopeptide repeat protein n=1 Tax=Flavobacterium phycosphaerae TaxID=2697515 RepID=UPI00138AE895|nr:hypothetical protein [Flavobacterium phycosphaerae]